MKTNAEQTLLRLKDKAVYRRRPLSRRELTFVRDEMSRGRLRCRILASLIGLRRFGDTHKRNCLRHLCRSLRRVRKSNLWTMRYASEVVMLLSGWGIRHEALLASAVRALKSGDRDSKINAASALSPYARRQHPVALTALKQFANDRDAAVRSNVLASLGTR